MRRLRELAYRHPWRWRAAWGLLLGAALFLTEVMVGQDVRAAALQSTVIGVAFGVVIAVVRQRQAKI
jgi:hypothetical protein